MSEPVFIPIPTQLTWVKVATAVKAALVHIMPPTGKYANIHANTGRFYHTYRSTGAAPPDNTIVGRSEGKEFIGNSYQINSLFDIDVYVFSDSNDGRVRVNDSPLISSFSGAAGQLLTSSLAENLFIKGESFSYQDYHLFAADEIKTFVFDPLACTCDQLLFETILFNATSGPILIDFYAGTTADDNGELGVSNRRSTSPIINEGIYRLNPTNITLGTRFSGELVPSTGLNPSTSNGEGSQEGLPFEILKTIKYAFTVENKNGADTYVGIKSTWFEVNL